MDFRKLIMKHCRLIYRLTVLFVFCLVVSLFYGCTKEIGETTCPNKFTSIRLSEPLLNGYTKALNEGDYEKAINTLRVIVAPQNPQSESDYIANKLFSGEELNNIVIDHVPVGTVQIFVFANEASVGKNYDNLSTFLQDINNTDDKLLIVDPDRTYFPKRGSNADWRIGLPMSWSDRNVLINEPNGTPQEIPIDLQRCVSKLRITMNNSLSETITIKEMMFDKFMGDRFYLFWEEHLDVPQDITYEAITYRDLNITIAANSFQELLLYIYPSHARIGVGSSPYRIGFTTTLETYDLQPFMDGGSEMSWISRNTQVNIDATLGANANIEIKYSTTEDWDKKDVTIPPFN